MRKDIHPTYTIPSKIVCSCGNEIVTGSTIPEMRIEICSKCHPFYTKQDRFIDTQGRVEKFKARALQAKTTKTADAKKVKKTEKIETISES